MPFSRSRLLVFAVPLLAVLAVPAVRAEVLNSTVQVGKVNINRTYQCGDDTLVNSTYQEGKVNINRTIQGCGGAGGGRGHYGAKAHRPQPARGERALAAKGRQRR